MMSALSCGSAPRTNVFDRLRAESVISGRGGAGSRSDPRLFSGSPSAGFRKARNGKDLENCARVDSNPLTYRLEGGALSS